MTTTKTCAQGEPPFPPALWISSRLRFATLDPCLATTASHQVQLARRGETLGTSEAKQILEHAIETGRGGCYLNLTPEQYRKLR